MLFITTVNPKRREYLNFPYVVQHVVELNALLAAIGKQISCVQR